MPQIEDIVYRGCPPGENLMPSWQMRQVQAREHNSSALLGCGELALIAQEGRPLKRCPDGDRNLIRVVKILIWGLIALISIPMRR
jgi:hypothetical protein